MSSGYGGNPTQIDYVRGVTSAGTWTRPANARLSRIYVKNNNANAITGGLKFGTSVGGVDIVAALAVGASVSVDAAPLLSLMSAAASTVFFTAVTAWNSANVDVAFEYVLPF